jgi:hypothetical protein
MMRYNVLWILKKGFGVRQTKKSFLPWQSDFFIRMKIPLNGYNNKSCCLGARKGLLLLSFYLVKVKVSGSGRFNFLFDFGALPHILNVNFSRGIKVNFSLILFCRF